MAKQTVLLVDADARSARVLEVSLRKAGYSVTLVQSAGEAVDAIEIATPDLVLSDTRLSQPDPNVTGRETTNLLDGYQLCRRLKDDPVWCSIPFIFLTSSSSIEDKIRGLELGVEDYLTKPIYIKEILTRIQLVLARKQREGMEGRTSRASFTGLLSEMGLVDLLSTIDLGRKSGVLDVESPTGTGTISFRDGRVVDARAGRYVAAAAVYRMLVWNDGRFEIRFGPSQVDDVVDMSTQGVLMEGMRRLDEWQRLQEQLPPLDSVWDVDTRELADRLGEIPDEVNQILRAFDGERTLLEVVDESGFDDLAALATLSKLYFEGLIHQRAPAHGGTGIEAIEGGGELVPGAVDVDGGRPDEAPANTAGSRSILPADNGEAARLAIPQAPLLATGTGTASIETTSTTVTAGAVSSAIGKAPEARALQQDDPAADSRVGDNFEERDVAKHRGKRKRTKREIDDQAALHTGGSSAAQAAPAAAARADSEPPPPDDAAEASSERTSATTSMVEEKAARPDARERLESNNVIRFPRSPSAAAVAERVDAAMAEEMGRPTLPSGTPVEPDAPAADAKAADAQPVPAKTEVSPRRASDRPSEDKASAMPKASEAPATHDRKESGSAQPRDRKDSVARDRKESIGGDKRERKISFSTELTDEAKAFFQDKSYEAAYKQNHDTFEDLKPEEAHDAKKARRPMLLTAGLIGGAAIVVGGLAIHSAFFAVPERELPPVSQAMAAVPGPALAANNAEPAAPPTPAPAAAPAPVAPTSAEPAAAVVPTTAEQPTAAVAPTVAEQPATAPVAPAPAEPVVAPIAPQPVAVVAAAQPVAAVAPAPTAEAPAPAGGAPDLLAAALHARSRGNAAASTAYQAYVDGGGTDANAIAQFAFWLANRGDLGHAGQWAQRASTMDATNQLSWYVLGAALSDGPHANSTAARDAFRHCARLPGAHAGECRAMQ